MNNNKIITHKKTLKNNCICDFCGKHFHKKPSHMTKHNFCSIKCHAEYKKIHFTGKNNHQYGLKGELNASFKSNEKIVNYGYRKIRALEHPFRDCDDFVFEHRLVAEKYLLNEANSIEVDGKKYLKKEYVVHHIDRNKLNNNADNLIVMTLSEHESLHQREDYVHKPKIIKEKRRLKGNNIKCQYCGKKFYTTDMNRKCCSVICSNKIRNRGTSIVLCNNCKKEFKIKNSRLNKSKHVFCSRKCYSNFKKKKIGVFKLGELLETP